MSLSVAAQEFLANRHNAGLTFGTIGPIVSTMVNVGRPLEFDPDKALVAAMEVFWRKGYDATSMNDLLAAMGISKSSLYQTFGNKQKLFEHCLARYAELLSQEMVEELDGAESGFSFIENLLETLANTAQMPAGARGCLMVSSVNEFGQRNPIISKAIANNLQRFSNLYLEAVRRAQSEGDIEEDADPAAIVSYLHVAVSGLRTMIKAGADRNAVQGAVALTLRALRT